MKKKKSGIVLAFVLFDSGMLVLIFGNSEISNGVRHLLLLISMPVRFQIMLLTF